MRTQPRAVLHALDNRQRWLTGGGDWGGYRQGDTHMRTQPRAVLHALDKRQRWLIGGGEERGEGWRVQQARVQSSTLEGTHCHTQSPASSGPPPPLPPSHTAPYTPPPPSSSSSSSSPPPSNTHNAGHHDRVCAHLPKEYHTRRHTPTSIHTPECTSQTTHPHTPAHTRGVVMWSNTRPRMASLGIITVQTKVQTTPCTHPPKSKGV